MLRHTLKLLSCLSLVFAVSAHGADAPKKRAISLDDLPRLIRVGAPVVSPDGEWALFRRFRAPHLVSLKSGKEDPARLNAGFTRVDFAAFCGRDSFARHGQRGNQQGNATRTNKAISEVVGLQCKPVIVR